MAPCAGSLVTLPKGRGVFQISPFWGRQDRLLTAPAPSPDPETQQSSSVRIQRPPRQRHIWALSFPTSHRDVECIDVGSGQSSGHSTDLLYSCALNPSGRRWQHCPKGEGRRRPQRPAGSSSP